MNIYAFRRSLTISVALIFTTIIASCSESKKQQPAAVKELFQFVHVKIDQSGTHVLQLDPWLKRYPDGIICGIDSYTDIDEFVHKRSSSIEVSESPSRIPDGNMGIVIFTRNKAHVYDTGLSNIMFKYNPNTFIDKDCFHLKNAKLVLTPDKNNEYIFVR